MRMLEHQIIVEIDVELAVSGRNQATLANDIAVLVEDLARYPSGPEPVSSTVAILYGDVQLFLRHQVPPRGFDSRSVPSRPLGQQGAACAHVSWIPHVRPDTGAKPGGNAESLGVAVA